METKTNDTSVHATSSTTTTDEEHRHYGKPILGLDRRNPKMRVDLTVNIPTMISLAVLIVTVSATGVGLYNNLDKRQMTTDFMVASITQRLDKNELAVANLKTEQVLQNQTLRSEMKSDIAEIKDMLNRLLFSPQQATPQQRQQLREWSK